MSSFPKKPLNVESPAFTPSSAQQQGNAQQNTGKKSTLPSQAANAAPFTPRQATKLAASTMPRNGEPSGLTATSRDFTPSNFDMGPAASTGSQDNNNNNNTAAGSSSNLYGDPFNNRLGAGIPAGPPYHNPYAADQGPMAMYVQPPPGSLQAGAAPPPNYHLYQPPEPFRGTLQPHQRSTYDFFMPAAMREEYQKKMFATQLVLPSMALPNIGEWQALTPLDTTNKKNPVSFGCPSWLYKAYHARAGHYYALRRLEGFGLSSQAPLQRMNDWKRIRNTNIVTVHEAFTTRAFGDSSLIFVYAFHPLSKTLQEQHFAGGRHKAIPVGEDLLWNYICQISNALKAIHSHNLAARCIELSKIIVDGTHVRLSGCAILDVTQHGTDKRSLQELQQTDLIKFGNVMLALASGNMASGSMASGNMAMPTDAQKAYESMNPKLSDKLKRMIAWLLSEPTTEAEKNKTIDKFIELIAEQVMAHHELKSKENDETSRILAMELENGRIARLALKLAAINERGDLGLHRDWSETGERYILKLFRDYVFHRVDKNGNPDLGIGHMISCMTKFDAGTEEQIQLISRDGEMVYVISYRELRNMLNRAFNELASYSKDGAPGA
ncbi:hypothetical protein QBC43DRAFT_96884 [Cladorrhinum sp. PSN259]|nr:hypothetical protein QBC43DRAFT_96884 [Cladorrhinum sp. PSN259]